MQVWQLQEPFCNVTSLSERYFRSRRFILLVQSKKVISMIGSSTSNWKPWRWVRFDLILTIRGTYINFNLNPLKKLTSSSRSTKFIDILPWNICQMITKTIATRWNGASCFEFIGKSMETETTIWWKSGGQAIVEQILASEERNISKGAGLWES